MHYEKFFFGLIAVVFLTASAGAQSSRRDSVTMVYTNNTNGYIAECDCDEILGGLDKRKTVFDKIRSENIHVIAVDAGDFLNQFGNDEVQDEQVIGLYEKLQYDAVTLGDNELANGPDFVNTHLLKSRLPLVSATLRKNASDPAAPPFMIKTLGRIRFGIIGYTPQSSFRYFPKEKRLEIKAEHEKEKLRSALDEISAKADAIIVLSHAGLDEDIQLARDFPMITIIAGAHSQSELQEPKQIGKTLILQAGGNGNYVGRLDLVFSGLKIQSFKNSLIKLDNSVREDSAFKSSIDRWLKRRK